MEKIVKFILGLFTCFFLLMGCYIMLKSDLSSTVFPFTINNLETAGELRAVFGGSLLAFGYLLLRFLTSSSNVTVSSVIIYILVCINIGRIVSLFYEGYLTFTFYSWMLELCLLILVWFAHKNRKNKIDYYL